MIGDDNDVIPAAVGESAEVENKHHLERSTSDQPGAGPVRPPLGPRRQPRAAPPEFARRRGRALVEAGTCG